MSIAEMAATGQPLDEPKTSASGSA